VQLSEKHREKRFFDKSECKVSFADLRPEVDVTEGGGKASSSTATSSEDICDICFNSLYRLLSINLRHVVKSASLEKEIR
jgi:hypothetical protein